jgi:hypothetical protein
MPNVGLRYIDMVHLSEGKFKKIYDYYDQSLSYKPATIPT